MSNETKLKPCPFCGGEARIDVHIFHGLSDTFGVVCKCCDAETAQFYATVYEAIGAWNRRATECT